MIRAIVVLSLGGLGCTGGIEYVTPPEDSSHSGDASTGCSVFLTFDPPAAIASPATLIRAEAHVSGAPGVLAYEWHVRHLGADTSFDEQPDHRVITFAAVDPGVYEVSVAVNAPGTFCPTAQADVNVRIDDPALLKVRMRVFPPSAIEAPPYERLVDIVGGANLSLNTVAVDPGSDVAGTVVANGAGIPAYLRFVPKGGPDAYVEAFSSTTGAFAARLLNEPHRVLVVPSVPGVAPQLLEDWLPGASLQLPPDTTISGTVRSPSNAAIAGAKVQLAIDGVPSTLTTSDAGGAFTVRSTAFAIGAKLGIDVTPPVSTGLPRIVAESSSLDPAQPVQIRYDAALTLRNVAGVVVRRSGVAQAGAKVTIAAELAAVASITTGALPPVSATGQVRITATANGGGVLPTTLAPAAPLSAVVALGAADFAVDDFDLTTGVPASINAAPRVSMSTRISDPDLVGLSGVAVELVPVGALAMANGPMIRVATVGGGDAALLVVAGGHYGLRISDPLGRAAPHVAADVTSTNLAASYTLPKALRLSGRLMLSGNAMPVGRASIQLRCLDCTGIERTRPIAEGYSTAAGEFDIAAPDPGTSL